MYKHFLLIIPFSLLVLASNIFGQVQASAGVDVGSILDSASEQRTVYVNEFKNLLATETKTFEVYDKKGSVKKRRSVQSTFIVYPLSKKEGAVSEFRNVISVDGEEIDGAEKRAQDFFEDVAKAESLAKEITRLEKEGSRYDEDISINGLTLYQAPMLAENMRPFFQFKLDETAVLDGRQVFVISYAQSKDSPYVTIDPKRIPTDGKMTLVYDLDIPDRESAMPRLVGKLWIDAQTYRVKREARALSISYPGSTSPLSVLDSEMDYHDGGLGILTPKRLRFTQLAIEKKAKVSRKEVSVVFEYSNFTRPDVEVKSADVKN